MIKAIRTSQFKRLHDHYFEFGPGLSAVTGDNGQGKSTLLKAVMFAMGLNSGLEKARIPTRNGNGNPRVELDVVIPGYGEVRINRTLTSGKITDPDGAILANGITACRKFVEEAYGMSSADLSLLLYARQGDAQALLSMGATELQKTVERLARAHVLDDVMGLMTGDMAQWQGELSGIGEVQDDGALEGEAAYLKRFLEELKGTMEGLRAFKNAIGAEEVKYVRACSAALTHREAVTRAAKEAEELDAQIQSWRQSLASLDFSKYPENVDALLREAEEKRKVANDHAASINSIMKLLKSLNDDLKHAEWRFSSAKERQAEADALAPQLRSAEAELIRVRGEYQARCDEATAAMKELREAQASVEAGVCRECKRPFDELEQEEAERRADAAFAASYRADRLKLDLVPVLKAAEVEYNKVARAMPQIRPGEVAEAEVACIQVRMKLESALQEHHVDSPEALEGVYKEWLTELNTQQQECVRLADLSRRFHHDTSRQEVMLNAVEDLQRKQEVLAERRRLLEAEQVDDFEEVEKQLDFCRSRLAEASRSLMEAEKDFALKTAELQRLLADIQKVKDAKVRRTEIQNKKDAVSDLHRWLRKSRSDLMQDLWDNLLGYTSSLMNRTTEGKISKVFRSGDELRVVEDGEEAPVSDLSGFQQSLLGLSLRIAMSRVFFGQDHPLLLDEPTSDAKENNAAKVAGMLQGLGSQVIFVTHREGDAVNASTIIQI